MLKAAQELRKAGFSPLATKKTNTKAPTISGWQRYCSQTPLVDDINTWFAQEDVGLTVACGTKLKNQDGYLAAIDIDTDDPDVMADIQFIIGADRPAKRGKKGKTIFVAVESRLAKNAVKWKTDGATFGVDILTDKCHTVLPPTKHADTDKPYHWIGPSDLITHGALPAVSPERMDELRQMKNAATRQRVRNLRTMSYMGDGGSTHDTCVAATGSYFVLGFSPDHIRTMLNQAIEQAMERCKDDGQWKPECEWSQEARNASITEWIESASKNEAFQEKKEEIGSKIPKDRALANRAKQKWEFPERTVAWRGAFRRYDVKTGVWRRVDAGRMRKYLVDMDSTASAGAVKGAFQLLQFMGYAPTILSSYSPESLRYIAFTNGVLDTQTMEFPVHPKREWFLMTELPFEWTGEDSPCPNYEKVISYLFEGKDEFISTFEEFAGLTFVPDLSFQKMLMIEGEGGTGKSTVVEMLRAMHDPVATSSIAISQLGNDQHVAQLTDSLCNISNEESAMSKLDDSAFKSAVSGEPLIGKIVYQEPFEFVTGARFIQCTNMRPNIPDTSEGSFRRIILLRANDRRLPDAEQDPELGRKLLEERSAVMTRYVAGLRRLRKRGGFDEPQESRDALRSFRNQSNPIFQWLQSGYVSEEEGAQETDLMLYQNYLGFCQSFSQSRLSMPKWDEALRRLGYPSTPLDLPGGIKHPGRQGLRDKRDI